MHNIAKDFGIIDLVALMENCVSHLSCEVKDSFFDKYTAFLRIMINAEYINANFFTSLFVIFNMIGLKII